MANGHQVMLPAVDS